MTGAELIASSVTSSAAHDCQSGMIAKEIAARIPARLDCFFIPLCSQSSVTKAIGTRYYLAVGDSLDASRKLNRDLVACPILALRVERISQGISKKIQRQERHRHGRRGESHQPPTNEDRIERRRAVGQQGTPTCRRSLHSQSQKT